MSIAKAWSNFINPAAAASSTPLEQSPPPQPPSKRRCDRSKVPPSMLTDAAVSVLFRHPYNATPPPRLAAFALPASIRPALLDRPLDVSFCLTLADGDRVHGSALQTCEESDDGQVMVLRALVVLSKWPVQELWRTMLKTIFSQGGTPLGGRSPAARPPPSSAALLSSASDASSSLDALARTLDRTAAILSQSGQELKWLTAHPLWLPTPLAPLFKALQWKPIEAAYLIGALLTDQRVLLHSEDPQQLYLATSALKALITPLQYTSVYIPLLPTNLMSLDEAATLLVDCGTPYLIGCESSLLRSFPRGPPASAVVVDLDRGTVKRAPGTEWFRGGATPPFASLCAELQRCMGAGSAFKALRAQGACLRFIVDLLNVRTGFLATSPAAADADALSRFCLLETLAEDASKRFKQQASTAALEAGGLDALRESLQQSVGGMLSELCARAALDHYGLSSGSGSAGGGGGALAGEFLQELSATAVETASAPAGGAACCDALAHIYAAQPFREWYGAPSRTRASERLQWMEYRSKGVELIEYLRENTKSMKVLERSLEQRLHEIWAAGTAPPSSSGTAGAE